MNKTFAHMLEALRHDVELTYVKREEQETALWQMYINLK